MSRNPAGSDSRSDVSLGGTQLGETQDSADCFPHNGPHIQPVLLPYFTPVAVFTASPLEEFLRTVAAPFKHSFKNQGN